MQNQIRVREHVQLTEYNTMGISAQARFFAEVNSVEELLILLKDERFTELPKMVLGGGSNILFLHDFDGLIIYNQIKGCEVISETEEHILLEIGAGENWHQMVMHCVHNGWGGIENLSLIPGSAGAAPIQNIGAYGVELEEVFVRLNAVMIESGELKQFTKQECRFGYRESIFKYELKGRAIITSVILQLDKNPSVNTSYRALAEALEKKGIVSPSIKDVSETVINVRQSKLPDPAEIGNTGSFFKNPVITEEQFRELKRDFPDMPNYAVGNDVKIPAAWLIDQCGWKGKRFGDAGVHEMQALVIVNHGKADGEQIWKLAGKIQNSVKERFGVELVPEVNVI